MLSSIHRLRMAMRKGYRSIRSGPTFFPRPTIKKLSTCTISTLRHPSLNVTWYRRPEVATKVSRDGFFGGSPRSIASIGSLAGPTKQQLPRDACFHSQIRQFLLEFVSAEQAFALSFPLSDQYRRCSTNLSSSLVASNHSFHMEVSNTLNGGKPCVLFNALGVDPANIMTPIFDRLVEKQILSLFKAYGLDKYGFILCKVLHDVHVVETGENWRNSWVLADCRSKAWKTARIQSVFLASQDQHCYISEIGDALGYPVLPTMGGYGRRYSYIDATATKELARCTGGRLGRVKGLEYLASDTMMQMQESREHFEQFCSVGRKYGREYVFHSELNLSLDENTETQLQGSKHGMWPLQY
jgi:hypothetical protein